MQAYSADMASFKQIRSFADSVRKDHPSIDVLINNAGASFYLSGLHHSCCRTVMQSVALTDLLKALNVGMI